MVRTDGCYVAGFRVGGALTYFADDEGRNEAEDDARIAFTRSAEQRRALQFRYEVVEVSTDFLLSTEALHVPQVRKFDALSKSDASRYGKKRKTKETFSPGTVCSLIWDPVKHKRSMITWWAADQGRPVGRHRAITRCRWERPSRTTKRTPRHISRIWVRSFRASNRQ